MSKTKTNVQQIFPGYGQCPYELPLPPPDMTNQKFRDLILNEKGEFRLKSIDELIPLLPETMRERVILAYESKSLQASGENGEPLVDFTTPRVILFDSSGQFRLAYTDCPDGHPNPRDCEDLEWQFFDPNTGELQFRSLKLPGSTQPNAPHLVNDAKENRNHFEVTPTSCFKCHGDRKELSENNHLRARFPPYNIWNGIYKSLGRQQRGAVRVGSPEHNGYLAFIRRVWSEPEKHKRYTSLVWGEQNKDKLLSALTKADINGAVDLFHGKKDDSNSEFNLAIDRYDSIRIAKQFINHPMFARYKLALFLMANCRDKLEQIVPDQARLAQIKKKVNERARADFKRTLAEVGEKNASYFGGLFVPIGPGEMQPTSDRGEFPTIKYIAEEMGGINTEAFSQSPEQPYNILTPTGVHNYLSLIRSVLTSCDPEIKKILEDGTPICSAAHFETARKEMPVKAAEIKKPHKSTPEAGINWTSHELRLHDTAS